MTKYNLERPFSTPFTIEIDSEKVANLLSLYHGRYFIQSNHNNHANIQITSVSSHKYEIFFQNHVLESSFLIKPLSHILYENTSYQDCVLPFHGSAVEYNGQAHVFLAPTTGGKSTLTSYLVYRGCGYLTDDCVLIDKSQLHVHPSLTPLHIRPDSLNILYKKGLKPNQYGFLNDGETRRYVYTPSTCFDKSLPIKHIYFLNRNDMRNDIERTPTIERTSSILKSSMVINEFNVNFLHLISRIIKLPCFDLYYKDMEFVYDFITSEKEG